MRALIIAMFMATAVGGALLLGFSTPQPAGAASQRTCSQSVTTDGRPGGLVKGYVIHVRTDTCGRWMRAEEKCKFPGAFGGFTYAWHAGKSVRAIGARSPVICGVLAVKVTHWGFGTYIRGQGWVFKQLGHS